MSVCACQMDTYPTVQAPHSAPSLQPAFELDTFDVSQLGNGAAHSAPSLQPVLDFETLEISPRLGNALAKTPLAFDEGEKTLESTMAQLQAELQNIKSGMLFQIHKFDNVMKAFEKTSLCHGGPVHQTQHVTTEAVEKTPFDGSVQKAQQETRQKSRESPENWTTEQIPHSTTSSSLSQIPKGMPSSSLHTHVSKLKLAEDVELSVKQLAEKEQQEMLYKSLPAWDLARQWLRQHRQVVAETFMSAVVIVNSITIGISCDHGFEKWWAILDMTFATIFLVELVIKLRMRGCRDFWLGKDKMWNLIEVALVILAWLEVFFVFVSFTLDRGANLFLLFRVLRLARIMRLLRVLRMEMFSELLLMIKGLLGGMRTLFWISILTFWPLYITCLVFRETLGRGADAQELFTNVPMAFFTLFRCHIAGDCSDDQGRPLFSLIAQSHGWIFALTYIILTMFMTFGLFNVVVAIYVENVIAAARADEHLLKKNRLRDYEFFNRKLLDLLSIIWNYHVYRTTAAQKDSATRTDSLFALSSVHDTVEMIIERLESIEITPDLFENVLADSEAKKIFEDLQLSDEDQFNMFETLDADNSGTLEIDELFDGIRKLRGPARRCDIMLTEILLRKVMRGLGVPRDDEVAERLVVEKCQEHMQENGPR